MMPQCLIFLAVHVELVPNTQCLHYHIHMYEVTKLLNLITEINIRTGACHVIVEKLDLLAVLGVLPSCNLK